MLHLRCYAFCKVVGVRKCVQPTVNKSCLGLNGSFNRCQDGKPKTMMLMIMMLNASFTSHNSIVSFCSSVDETPCKWSLVVKLGEDSIKAHVTHLPLLRQYQVSNDIISHLSLLSYSLPIHALFQLGFLISCR